MSSGHGSFLDEDLARINFIAEMEHTQLGPGRPELKGMTLFSPELFVGRMQLEPKFAGRTVLQPDWALFWVPMNWKGEYRFNGATADQTTVGLVTGPEGYFTRGENADGVGMVVRQSALRRDLAALTGVSPEELTLPDGPLTMPWPAIQHLRQVLGMYTGRSGSARPGDWFGRLREEMLEALVSTSLPLSSAGRDQRNETIVRRAEEFFMSVYPAQPALSDLCRAAGVGKNRLYAAFGSLLGETPVAYFRKRRYSSARKTLIQSSSERGLIKRIALNHGFTELGRFSTEYRQLFGEQPSHTLCYSD